MVDKYKVLITTSGIGSRLGELTKYTNKSLVRIGKKPALSYIIERYDDNVEIVITLGHFGNQVKDFINMAYPNKKITYVQIDNYMGPGSSLLYSILKTKEYLQTPFIFHVSDTIIDDNVVKPYFNYIIGSNTIDTSQNRKNKNNNNKIKIQEKGYLGDIGTDNYLAHIGLVGVFNYKDFWKTLEKVYKNNKNSLELSDVHVINEMKNDFTIIKTNNWLDIGNSKTLSIARKKIKDKFDILDKNDESIFIFKDFVIKFFYDKKIAKNRAYRCDLLKELTPKLIDYKNNFYKYEYINGILLSKVINENIFSNFLEWSFKNLWKKTSLSEFHNITYDFYINKTIKRIEKYQIKNNLIDKVDIINGIKVPKIEDMLNHIDKKWLCSSESYQYHGDYILDNIIFKDNNFILIDWRQDFGGDLENGDIYYDLAKLNHNLVFNHDLINKKMFTIKMKNDNIICDIFRSNNLIECQKILHSTINKNNIDLKKVELLSSIIWLNMSPLHNGKLGEFLYYFGKINLYKNLKKNNMIK